MDTLTSQARAIYTNLIIDASVLQYQANRLRTSREACRSQVFQEILSFRLGPTKH